MKNAIVRTTSLVVLTILLPGKAEAAALSLDGASMSLVWLVPFAGILASIALGPLVAPVLWHHHHGKIVLFWALAAILPLVFVFGPAVGATVTLHALVDEYVPFIVLLFALFTIAGGILVRGRLSGAPAINIAILAFGAIIASIIGTTGASMVLIRPIIRANAGRPYNVHVVVFFIFLVSNIGGALSPLGDPPLFVGFLRGVDFFWTTQHMWLETLTVGGLTLLVFAGVDIWLFSREKQQAAAGSQSEERVAVVGTINILLIAGVIAAIIASAVWKPGITLEGFGVSIELQDLLRDLILVGLAVASLLLTPDEQRTENGFHWEPIKEVAKLFFGIFICVAPVLAILSAGENGALGALVRLVAGHDGHPDNVAYFWLTGGLSSFLDNVPTYLVFFQLAGGDAQALMGHVAGHEYLARTLAAISSGAVYMGANTYIGNAPNFMVYAIAKDMGVKMPSFFGYLIWSGLILLPIFAIATVLFFV